MKVLTRVIRFLVWTLIALIIFIVIVLAVLYWLAGTDSGFSRTANLANKHVEGLEIVEPSGNLFRGISAQSVLFSNDTIDVKATALDSDWRVGCLFKRGFCFDKMHLQELYVTSLASATEEPPPEPRDQAIELPEINLPINIDVTDIRIDTFIFQGPDDAPEQRLDNLQLSANTQQSKLNIKNLSLDYQPADAPLNAQPISAQLSGDIELSGDYPLTMLLTVSADDVLPDTILEGEGAQPISINTTLSNSLADLALNTRISGLVDANIELRAKPLEPTLPAKLNISSARLGWPVISQSQVLAENLDITVSGDMNDYRFSIDTQVSGEQAPETRISLSGVANTQRITLPSINIETLGGVTQGRALASLAQPIVWSSQWDIADIDPSIQVPDLMGKLNGTISVSGVVDGERWSIDLNEAVIDGTLRDLPFRLDAKVSKELNNLWRIDNVSLNNDKNLIEAQGRVGENIDISADINLPQLQNIVPELAGGFDATVKVQGDLASPDIALDAQAEVLRFNDILVRSLAMRGDIDKLFFEDSTLNIDVESVRAGENTVNNTTLALTGQRDQHQLNLSADGPQSTAMALALSGALDETFNWAGVLGEAQINLPSHKLNLADPININWLNDDQKVSVSSHCWSISGEASLCLKQPFNSGPEGNTSLALEQYSLNRLNAFLPENMSTAGLLGADVDLSWGGNGPSDRQALVTAKLSDAQLKTVDALGDPVVLDIDQIRLNVDAQPDNAQAVLAMNSQTLGSTTVVIKLDPSDPDSTLDGSLDLQALKLDIAQAFLPDFDEVSGTITAQGTLAGTLTEPDFNGAVVLDEPVLRAEILPLPVTGGRLVARISGQRMTLNGQVLSDEGSVEVEGRGTLDPENWRAQVSLKGRQLNLSSEPLMESTINHDINIDATARRISVTGDIDIPQAIIDVEELPEGVSTVSDDVVIIEDIEEQAPTDAPASSLNLAVALDVSLGDDVTVSAYGLDANLTGDMDVRIRGNKPPQLGGEIRVVDGIFKKYGQDLEANGQVLFVGPIDGTRLAIDAVREIESEDRTAGLRIQGTVAEPEITLFTDPSDKSQDAILSYVILGRDINQASDQEADLLATAAIALAVRGGKTVGSGLASRLGVEEFALESRGSGNDAELVVSGRLNDRLLLRYGRGVFNAEKTLYLRYDLTKKLYLEAAQGAERAADLFYSFEF